MNQQPMNFDERLNKALSRAWKMGALGCLALISGVLLLFGVSCLVVLGLATK